MKRAASLFMLLGLLLSPALFAGCSDDSCDEDHVKDMCQTATGCSDSGGYTVDVGGKILSGQTQTGCERALMAECDADKIVSTEACVKESADTECSYFGEFNTYVVPDICM